MSIYKKIMIIPLMTLSLSLFAAPLAQRNCTPDDLNLDSQVQTSAETFCTWSNPNDVSMQVTLHASEYVSLINATCIFTPTAGKENIVQIRGFKSAVIRNFNPQINTFDNRLIQFQVMDQKSDPNLNVAFYLSSEKLPYTFGSKMHCLFTVAK